MADRNEYDDTQPVRAQGGAGDPGTGDGAAHDAPVDPGPEARRTGDPAPDGRTTPDAGTAPAADAGTDPAAATDAPAVHESTAPGRGRFARMRAGMTGRRAGIAGAALALLLVGGLAGAGIGWAVADDRPGPGDWGDRASQGWGDGPAGGFGRHEPGSGGGWRDGDGFGRHLHEPGTGLEEQPSS